MHYRASSSLLALSILFNISCETIEKSGETQTSILTKQNRVSPTEVVTVPAVRKTFKYFISSNGKVESRKEAELQLRTTGMVERVYATNADFVKKGDVLLELENEEQRLALEKAKVSLREKQLEYEDRLAGFSKQSPETFDVVKENIRYSSGLAQAEVLQQIAQLAYDHTIVKAPMSGVVSNLTVKEGHFMNAGQVICLIHDPTALEISCPILESEVKHLAKGQQVTVRPLFQDITLVGNLASINPRVDGSGLVSLKVTLEAKNIFPGANVAVQVAVPYEKNIVVPKEAVVLRAGKHVVFTVEDRVAIWNFVKIGRDNGGEVEILEGLREGQKVIVTDNLQLGHNAPVIEKDKD